MTRPPKNTTSRLSRDISIVCESSGRERRSVCVMCVCVCDVCVCVCDVCACSERAALGVCGVCVCVCDVCVMCVCVMCVCVLGEVTAQCVCRADEAGELRR